MQHIIKSECILLQKEENLSITYLLVLVYFIYWLCLHPKVWIQGYIWNIDSTV